MFLRSGALPEEGQVPPHHHAGQLRTGATELVDLTGQRVRRGLLGAHEPRAGGLNVGRLSAGHA
ncbi:hypothetical protein [Paraburkholderia hospita]|uniref:hypothetical protein n=1 Tax=Paraburkholderia hospita TaxID=169430 RepID=UPI0009C5CE3D|nr:hypothetical protein [Paraburkholderia hospita]SKC69576.1 hypothetical protein SAMN05446934_1961 [Paraburkholderia hospita]